jgi:Heterokaryon incompatibility protein (HET)
MTTRPANLDIGAPAAFERAKSWLDECMHSHPKCQRISPASSELPTRVLEISSVGENEVLSIRLYPNTTKEVAPYAALSYVWGGPQAFRTLQSNIASHNSQISLSILPQTIQDAVFCAHKLGLKYLWVDSLCIIQDSREDREREITYMAQIYKNAFVTISAAGAKGCHEGFLETEGRATTHDLRKQSFKIDIATPKDPEVVKEWIEAGR